MRALLYVRRSTAEHQALSLDVQTDEARRFCAARGWTVVDVLLEDGVSRAEFVHRPALGKLLALAASKPRAIDVVVMRDETRLGGDMYRTGMVLQELHDRGVEVWYYATAERVSFEDPTAKLMAAVRLYASEVERLKIAGRTREALVHRHRAGHNVGGVVYGYDNVRVVGTDGRAHTEYRINPAQAEVVRELFERHARGEGVRGIAKALNSRRVPAPRAGARGTGSWSPSCVHAMLRRERYRGRLEYGHTGAKYALGTRTTVERDAGDVVVIERPDLAIVSAELWEAAQARTTEAHGRKFGRVPAFLLTGFARCAKCHGPIHGTNSKRAKSEIIKVYECGYHRARGEEVCDVTTRRPVTDVDHVIVGWIRRNVLSAPVVDAILRGVKARFEAGKVAPQAAEAEELRRELARVERQVARLTSALAESDDAPASIVAGITEREARARELRERLTVLDVARPIVPASWEDIEARARRTVEDLGALWGRDLQTARKALGALLDGPLTFTATVRNETPAWKITGMVRLPGGCFSVSDPNGNRTDQHPVSVVESPGFPIDEAA